MRARAHNIHALLGTKVCNHIQYICNTLMSPEMLLVEIQTKLLKKSNNRISCIIKCMSTVRGVKTKIFDRRDSDTCIFASANTHTHTLQTTVLVYIVFIVA